MTKNTQIPEKVKLTHTGRAALDVKPVSPVRDGESVSDSLPCLYSNNCIENPQNTDTTPKDIEAITGVCGLLTAYHKRQAHTLYSNVERLISQISPTKSHIAFFTLTFPKKIYDHREVSKRWHSLNTNYLQKHSEFGEWLLVKEQHKDGAWHLHCLIVMGQDIRQDFDFDTYQKWLDDYQRTKRRKRLNTGSKYLRSLWMDLRTNLKKYGFGRSELVPIRSNEQAMARYVGKYVSKHISQRSEESKGCRLITYSRGWPKNSINMAWHTPNATDWRRKVAIFAEMNGCTELYQLATKLGSDWAYRYAQDIFDINPYEDTSQAIPYEDPALTRAKQRAAERQSYLAKNLTLHTPKTFTKEKSKEAYRIGKALEDYTSGVVPWPVRYYHNTFPDEVPF